MTKKLTFQRTGDDFVVRNGDFFAAVHFIMSNKHSRNRRDDAFKVNHTQIKKKERKIIKGKKKVQVLFF